MGMLTVNPQHHPAASFGNRRSLPLALLQLELRLGFIGSFAFEIDNAIPEIFTVQVHVNAGTPLVAITQVLDSGSQNFG
jgi:hypothetical protein